MESNRCSCIKTIITNLIIGFIFSATGLRAAEKCRPIRNISGLSIALGSSIDEDMSCESENELRRSGTVLSQLNLMDSTENSESEDGTDEELEGAKACFTAIAEKDPRRVADLLKKFPKTQVNKYYGEKTLRDAALGLPRFFSNKAEILHILDKHKNP